MKNEIIEKKSKKICEFLDENRKNPFGLTYSLDKIISTVSKILKKNEAIPLLLPAFHCKSRNKQSVISALPDAGELLGIETLATICNKIMNIAEMPVKLFLLHEGHFYSDTELVENDAQVNAYMRELRKMLEPYSFMVSYDITDFYVKEETNDERRNVWLSQYAKTTQELRSLIIEDSFYRELYTGYKKLYLVEYKEILLREGPGMKRRAKICALEQLKRHLAFSSLVKSHFKKLDYIKLSLVYKPPEINDQIAINLIPGNHSLGTAGFNVLVRYLTGNFGFMKKWQAENAGYILSNYKGYKMYEEKAE